MVNNLFGLTGVGRAVERGRRTLKSIDIFLSEIDTHLRLISITNDCYRLLVYRFTTPGLFESNLTGLSCTGDCL